MNSPSTCSTLMLWANHLKESNKIDSGMMPPPSTTLPLNIRRTSISGLLTCGTSGQSSPPILKAEIMDENSQNSILSTGADTMNHDSMDTFTNDNSMDASNSAHSLLAPPLELMMQKNVEMTNTFPSTLNQSGLLNIASSSNINDLHGVDLRVKQEEDMAAQIQDLVNPNRNENSSFLSAFNSPKMNDLKVQVNDVPIFNVNPSTNVMNNSTDVMLNNNLSGISHLVGPSLPTEQQIQQTIEQQQSVFTTQTLMTEAGTANGLNHMLSFPSSTQTISPNIMSTSPTNQSPLSADVMLNSQPISAMNTSPLLAVKTTTNNTSISPIESDIIMNPSISPTMMCNNQSNDANNSLIPNAATISDNSMLVSAPQPASEALLNNLMQPMSIERQDVKNMILNAAAEILSSEPNSITPETTTNALMSLNNDTAPQQITNQPSPPSITNILTHSDSTSSVVVLAGNNKLIQNVVAAAAAQNASDIIQVINNHFCIQLRRAKINNKHMFLQNHIVPEVTVQMGSFPKISTQIVNVQPTTTAANAAAANLSPAQQNLLNNIQ